MSPDRDEQKRMYTVTALKIKKVGKNGRKNSLALLNLQVFLLLSLSHIYAAEAFVYFLDDRIQWFFRGRESEFGRKK